MIDLSLVVNSPYLTQPITIERTAGGHFEGGEYVTDAPPMRFTAQGIFNPDQIKEISPNPLGARATGHINALFDKSIVLYTTHDKGDENDISDQIVIDAGTDYESTFRIISVNVAYGVRIVEAERVGAI
jgi:hypothetical protein